MSKSRNTNKFFIWRGAIGVIILAPAVLLGFFRYFTVAKNIYWWLISDIAGWLFFSCGIALRLWGALYVGGRKDDCLVTEGPYSICRNPIYLGSFCLMLSVGFFLKSIIILSAIVIMFVIYALGTIAAEEKFLSQRFQESYKQYCARTPRLLPRFKNFNSPEKIEVNLKAFSKEVKKTIGWVFLPIFTAILAFIYATK
ncbi:MAG: isoprenylcysteine carboxylmethyltransferase family protein [Candidatus Omnitrophica bacterium]|nr:isoprenylcysteine carboxylmethyltransferase family protein [Candidatus Omnitrophota bacterium]